MSVNTLIDLSKKLFAVAASVAVVGLLGVYKLQLFLVYPSSLNNARNVLDTPDAYDLPYDDVSLTTPDGETLHAFAIRQNADSATYTNKTIVMLSPNAGNIGNYLPIARLFYDFGYNVFIYSYRGYGKSTGTASEKGLKLDADTAMEFLAQDIQFSQSSIVLYGRSLGGAVSIYLASKHPQAIAGVVLENTFLCLPKVVPHIFPVLARFAFMLHQRWPSEEIVGSVPLHIPFLFMNGLKDEIVPPSHMQLLYELCLADVKEIHKFANGYHNDTLSQPEYWEIVHDFIKMKVNPIGH
ncbi:hypothetical protein BABINDRAFT_160593 [Babjeviella inositovora NRRL Y-12698]|uniref:Serine aminopeptidase S33 domain-containing protein n=1 Tax=Babjeviella inositovora NRRL Y-12698 TaxID=984486 RepID=A0A1E3QU31_9ASCO|nr:uncharacterized protein BABINDRAFT_160593 [Babjeviella inositovora NRRL Y-12698]ODQ81201.1 hypothetical protein BABINDRAFT_160593 [Babjeviella inositovora NRRL Y-12698]